MPPQDHRNLTDADVEAIVERLQSNIVSTFYTDLGKGLWAHIKRAVIYGLIALAAYGAAKSNHWL